MRLTLELANKLSSSSRRSFTVWGKQIPSAVVAGTVLFVVLVALAVLPFRTWMNQRQEAERLESELELVQSQNELLEEQSELLETPAEVERRAREDYGYVYPGEEQYVVQPAEEVEE